MINKARLFLVSILQTVYTVLIIWLDINNLYYKIAIFAISSIILTSNFTIKNYIKVSFAFLIITFASGGMILALCYMFKTNPYDLAYSIRMTMIYILAFILILFPKILKVLVCKIKNKLIFSKKVEIFSNDKNVTILAYFDSGNQLYFESNPVSIISERVLARLYSKAEINKLEQVVQVSTITNNEKLRIIKLDELRLTDEKLNIRNFYVAISNQQMDYDLILHADMR